MQIFNRHKNTVDPDIINNIGGRIDEDINSLLKDGKLSKGSREIPEFDEYTVFERILSGIEQSKKRKILPMLKWACVIAMLLANAAYFLYPMVTDEIPVYREIYAPKGERLVVLLTDGSRVWLNADSKLTYPEHFAGNERNVSVEGEAYFEVKKNPENPFMVQVDNIKIKVTGTSFNVCAYPSDNEIITTLDEGKIRIGDKEANSQLYDVKPGETAIYDKAIAKYTIVSDEKYSEVSSWRDNRLVFRNTSLENVLKTLSRRFDVTFEIAENSISSYTYNFGCSSNDLSNVIEMMSSITPIKFKRISQNKYKVSDK